MDNFFVQEYEAFLDCGVYGGWSREGGCRVCKGGLIGLVEFTRNEGNEDLTELC